MNYSSVLIKINYRVSQKFARKMNVHFMRILYILTHEGNFPCVSLSFDWEKLPSLDRNASILLIISSHNLVYFSNWCLRYNVDYKRIRDDW